MIKKILNSKNLLFLFISLSLVVISCSSNLHKADDLRYFNDTINLVSVAYPQKWVTQYDYGKRFAAYTSTDVIKRFGDFNYTGNSGARIDVIVTGISENQTAEDIARTFEFANANYRNGEYITVNSNEVFKVSYSFPIKEGTFYGEIYIFTPIDEPATILRLEAFDKNPEKYSELFREVLLKLKPGQTPKIPLGPPPSKSLMNVMGEGFIISIPSNFALESRAKTPNAIAAYTYMGERRADSFIRVDIFEAARNLTIWDVYDFNVKHYNNIEDIKEKKIGEYDAITFYYSASEEINGKVLFCLVDKRLYRVIINWYIDEANLFKSIFEESLSSFKLR